MNSPTTMLDSANIVYYLLYSLSYMIVHLSIVSQDGATPLNIASQEGHTKVVDVLLKNGADPNLSNAVSTE